MEKNKNPILGRPKLKEEDRLVKMTFSLGQELRDFVEDYTYTKKITENSQYTLSQTIRKALQLLKKETPINTLKKRPEAD